MKLHEGEGTAVLTGGLESPVGTFSIKANAKAFAILSSGLYTDKILAVIRELACNAYDAHVAVGKADEAFEVHLPNQFEPFFRISDLGPGLSEEDIYGLYTTYFASSKTDSNDFIGALGLGSKSPFSYAQTFTVTSRYGGQKKVYTAFLTEEGMPSIVKMSEEDWTGPTGIDVQLAVKSNDIYTFADRAQGVFVYFPVRPKFTGKTVEIETIEYTTRGTGWAIRKQGGGARAIQGVVSYPVPQTNDQDADELLRLGVDLFFPIGELEVAASREALSMTKATAKNLADRIKMVATELGAEITKSLETAPTLWEAVKLYTDLMQNGSVRYALKNVDLKWQGQKLQDYFEIRVLDWSGLRFHCLERRRYGRSKTKEVDIKYVTPKDFVLVRNDLTRGSKGILTRWVKQFGDESKKYYLVSTTDTTTQADIDRFFEQALGGVTEIQKLSDLKAALPKIVRGSNGQPKDLFQVFEQSHRGWRDSWAVAEDDAFDGDTIYYIPTYKSTPGSAVGGGPEDNVSEPSKLAKLKTLLVRMGLMGSDDPIFSGSARMLAAAQKDEELQGRLMNVMDLTLEAIKLTPAEATECKSVKAIVFDGIRRPEKNLEVTLKAMGVTPDNWHIPALADLVNAYSAHFQAEEIKKKYQDRIELAVLLGKGSAMGISTAYPNLSNLKQVTNKYKLIGGGFGTWTDWSLAKEAVNLIVMLHNAENSL